MKIQHEKIEFKFATFDYLCTIFLKRTDKNLLLCV